MMRLPVTLAIIAASVWFAAACAVALVLIVAGRATQADLVSAGFCAVALAACGALLIWRRRG